MKTGTRFTIVKGIGSDTSELGSFDSSLISAGISDYNLVKVSSILPANMEQKDSVTLVGGEAIYIAYASKTTSKSESIAAAIAVALPKDPSKVGVIMEVSNECSEEKAIQTAESLAIVALKKRGCEVDRVLSCGVSTVGINGVYTTVFAGIAMY